MNRNVCEHFNPVDLPCEKCSANVQKSTLREAAQQALEALQLPCPRWNGTQSRIVNAAIDALRAALAEPVQEPVAWIQPDHLQKARQAPFLSRVEPTQRFADFVPLYLAPPQRKPLTEEEIVDAVREADLDWKAGWTLDEHEPNRFTTLARAIEKAHGIGEKE